MKAPLNNPWQNVLPLADDLKEWGRRALGYRNHECVSIMKGNTIFHKELRHRACNTLRNFSEPAIRLHFALERRKPPLLGRVDSGRG